ncbi:unnamed protein product [Vicia faba]|uniref:DUF1977 domain-containing protein n=1 Tax=Vicia faba TaxID=3906 RepID=A0AAV0Z4V9_VICFA|nr:unnamed protein product [Vicia faba]
MAQRSYPSPATQFDMGSGFVNYDVCGEDEVVYERRDAARPTSARGFNVYYDADVEDPVDTLSQNYPFEHWLTTPKGVNYYVKSTKFEQDYPLDSRERLIIEERVEREYFGILRQNCQFEMQGRQWRYIRETPHCDMFRKFDSVR